MNVTTADMKTKRIPVEEFPILAQGLFANHAAISPWPRRTSQAVAEFAHENSKLGPENYNYWLRRQSHLRKMLAGLVNAVSPGDIGLLKNTTECICTVANGIDWQHGDNLVIPLAEFPSNRLPWLALQSRGVEVREVDIRSTSEPEKALLAHMDEKTRLLSVSAVQWTDGLRLQLETLGNSCRQHSVLFCVDAIQQLGAMQIDVQACGIDFLAADAHKWLLGPEGIALFYSRASIRGQLQLKQLGWHMVDDPYQFNRDQWQPSKTAIRFEAGSPNTLGQAALHASVGLLQEFGMRHVESCITANSLALSEGLANIRGVELVRPFDAQRVSGIISFKTPGKDVLAVQRELKQRRLTCAVRDNTVRLSPHFYQAGEPVQNMLNMIENVTYKSN
jgi:selenocysteine lyase/cysteine desulfurase